MGKLNYQKLRRKYSYIPVLTHHNIEFETEGKKYGK